MQNQLKIAAIQTNLTWENSHVNLASFQTKIDLLDEVDLIVLPEMFSTGFTMQPTLVAETMDGNTVQWMITIATSNHRVFSPTESFSAPQ